jgi:4-carboxymuconolactone decarboxylase
MTDPASTPLKGTLMTDETTGWTGGQRAFGDYAPGLVHYTDRVLFDEVWERPQLSKRDRSLVTVAALLTAGTVEQLNFHLAFAKQNGATQEELVEAITHLAFYAGWPKAMSAMTVAKNVFAMDDSIDHDSTNEQEK